jgi:hypothetical protein
VPSWLEFYFEHNIAGQLQEKKQKTFMPALLPISALGRRHVSPRLALRFAFRKPVAKPGKRFDRLRTERREFGADAADVLSILRAVEI